MVRFRWLLAIVAAGLSALLYPVSQQVKQTQRSLGSLFAPDDPRLLAYHAAQLDFEIENLCGVVYADPELLTAAGMRRLRALTERLRQVPGIRTAKSLADLPRPGRVLVGGRSLAEEFQAGAHLPATLRGEVLGCEMYLDNFIGRDGQTAAILLDLDSRTMSSGDMAQSIARLRQIAAEHTEAMQTAGPTSGPPTTVVGTPILISDVFDFLEQDSRTLTQVSLATVLAVLLLWFRSLRWVVVPLLVVQMALIATRAYMAASGVELSLVGAMTTSLVTVIGIATTIHLAMRFQEESASAGSLETALERTLAAVLPAIFWTCATTAAGFGALIVSRVAPVRHYGQVMAVASLAVGVAAALIVPWGALFLCRPKVPARRAADDPFAATLAAVARIILKHERWVGGCFVLLAVAGVLGLARLEVETDFTRNFRANSPLLQGYRFVEDRLGGAGTIEVSFDTPGELTPEFLTRLRQCRQQLLAVPGVTKAATLVDLIDFVDEAVPGSRFLELMGPLAGVDFQTRTVPLKLLALRAIQPRLVEKFWRQPERRMRIQLRVREQQAMADKAGLVRAIETETRAHFGESVQVTGLYVLLVGLIDGLLADQWRATGVSAAGIIAMLALAGGSLRWGLVAFLPNLVPVVLVLGLMGWLGLRIDVATAMIGSIAMGLVVDFSIHYMARYRRMRADGLDTESALVRTHQTTGMAMTCATVALTLGFGVLCLSGFLPTVHFGALVGLAMAGGFVTNLALLPMLLRWIDSPAGQEPGPLTNRPR